MSYAIVRNEKLTRAEVNGKCTHNDRKAKCHTNKDIDPIRTHLNYYIKKNNYTYTKEFEGVAIEDQSGKFSLEAIRDFLRSKAVAKLPVFWKEEITLANATKVIEYGKAFLTNVSYEAPAEGEMTFSGTLNGIDSISATDLVLP